MEPNNIKINLNRPELTPEEINANKRFKTVYESVIQRPTYKRFINRKYFGGLLLVLAITAVLVVDWHEEKEKKIINSTTNNPITTDSTTTITNNKQTEEVVESSVVANNDNASNNVVKNNTVPINETKKVTALTFDDFKKAPQVFRIHNDRDTVIEGNEGTIITIKANSFQVPLTSIVDVYLEEYYKMEDILPAKLSTMSNNNLLETGGMININAKLNQDNITLSKQLQLQFPYEKEKKDMQLFGGEWDSVYINWKLIPQTQSVVPFTNVEQMPQFPNGEEAMNRFLSNNIRYPAMEKENGISGTVYLTFVVEIDGSISDIRVLRGFANSKEFEKEAIRVVKKMPKWTAGKQSGENVRVQFNLPFKFTSVGFDEIIDSSIDTSLLFTTTPSDVKNLSISQRANAINYYAFSTSKLGWVNCDRFLNVGSSRINYIFNEPFNQNTTISLVFKKYKSVIASDSYYSYSFHAAPIGEEVTVVAIKFENNKVYLAQQETTISQKGISNLSYREVSKSELKNSLAKLNTQ